jgi:Mn-dependent DtxR family transcriptional regulator
MTFPDLTDTDAAVLRAVHTQEDADLYDLAQAMGAGPRAVQETVQRLAQHDLVHASGRRVRCTRAGDRWVRQHE